MDVIHPMMGAGIWLVTTYDDSRVTFHEYSHPAWVHGQWNVAVASSALHDICPVIREGCSRTCYSPRGFRHPCKRLPISAIPSSDVSTGTILPEGNIPLLRSGTLPYAGSCFTVISMSVLCQFPKPIVRLWMSALIQRPRCEVTGFFD